MHDSRQVGTAAVAAIGRLRLCHYGYLVSGRIAARVSLKPRAHFVAGALWRRPRTGIKVDFTRAVSRRNPRGMWRQGDKGRARTNIQSAAAPKPASCAMFMGIEIASNVAVGDVVRKVLDARSIAQTVLPHEDLREVGLTSLDMVSLVLSVESEFGIKIPEREITPTNFRSIATIETLVARLRG
jgi:acyl carrier protein